MRSGIKAGSQSAAAGMTALCALLVALVLGGCGLKTMPVPPQEIVPAAITDLHYELDEKGVTLTWTYPAKTVRGEDVSEISAFDLYRAVVPADSYCDTCPIPFGEPIQIPGGVVPEGKPKTGTYTSTLLRPGHIFIFMVRSRSGWWAESGDSNVVSFLWDIPPAAPGQLGVQTTAGGISLSWLPVTTYPDGSIIREPVKYQVYRSQGGGPFAPLAGLQDKAAYTDTQVEAGRSYQYKVQAVIIYAKGQVGGGVTAPVTAEPVKRTASGPPEGVTAVRTVAGVKVLWNALQDSAVRGYRVYRRLPGEKQATMVGEVSAPGTLFDDPAPPPAEKWFYSVTSIDNASPPNESRASAEVEARN
jgi:hypothetical protein